MRRLVDARLAVPAATAWVAAAVVQTWSPRHAAVLAAGSVLAGVVGFAASGRGRTAMVVAATCLGIAGGAAAMGMHVAALHRGPVASLARSEQTVELGMRLVRDPVEVHSHSGRRLVVADATAFAVRRSDGSWQSSNAPVTMFAMTGPWIGLLPGQRLTVVARLRPPRPGDLVAAVGFAVGPPRLVGSPPFWQRWAGGVRAALRGACLGLGADERQTR